MFSGSLPGVATHSTLNIYSNFFFSCFSFYLIGLHKLIMVITSGEQIVASQREGNIFRRIGC